MQLHKAYTLINKFKEEYPEKVFALGLDLEFTDKGLEELVYVYEQFYLSEYITKEKAFEKAIRFSVKKELK